MSLRYTARPAGRLLPSSPRRQKAAIEDEILDVAAECAPARPAQARLSSILIGDGASFTIEGSWMDETLEHPPCVSMFRARVPHDRPIVRLFEEDGHIRPMLEIKADIISAALRMNGGSLAKTAQTLRIGRTTLYRKLLKR